MYPGKVLFYSVDITWYLFRMNGVPLGFGDLSVSKCYKNPKWNILRSYTDGTDYGEVLCFQLAVAMDIKNNYLGPSVSETEQNYGDVFW